MVLFTESPWKIPEIYLIADIYFTHTHGIIIRNKNWSKILDSCNMPQVIQQNQKWPKNHTFSPQKPWFTSIDLTWFVILTDRELKCVEFLNSHSILAVMCKWGVKSLQPKMKLIVFLDLLRLKWNSFKTLLHFSAFAHPCLWQWCFWRLCAWLAWTPPGRRVWPSTGTSPSTHSSSTSSYL